MKDNSRKGESNFSRKKSGKQVIRDRVYSMYRMKNKHSMKERFVLMGPRWDRQFLHKAQGKSHLMRNKSAENRRRNKKLK